MTPQPTPAPGRPSPAQGPEPISSEQLHAWLARRSRTRKRLKFIGLSLLLVGVAGVSIVWTFFHQQFLATAHLQGLGFAVDWELNRDNLLQGGVTTVGMRTRWASNWGPITARDLESISSLRHVTILDLSSVPMRDDDLAFVSKLEDLIELHLERDLGSNRAFLPGSSPLTDGALKHFRGLKKLTSLSLGYNQISDAGLGDLQELPALKNLDLANTQITDAGLRKLANLKSLETLNLDETKVTDKGLEALKGLKSLKYLRVEKTGVTFQGVARFQAVRSDVEVVREQPTEY